MQIDIRVTFFNKIQKGQLIGTFGIHIKQLDIFFTDLKLLATKEGGCFVAPPCRTYLCEKTGKEQFQNYWWFGQEKNKEFQKTCHDAVKDYFDKHPESDPRKVTEQQQENKQ